MSKKREDGFTLIELMTVVAIIGILASVAIPSFIRYIAKSKSAEARMHLEKVYNGARVYFNDPGHSKKSLNPIDPRFPDPVAATPAVGCCAFGGKCVPSQAAWANPTWNALAFSMDEPHYYQYEFLSSGIGEASQFTAVAIGNLDCDSSFSTFSMFGRVDPGGTVVGAAALHRSNELE